MTLRYCFQVNDFVNIAKLYRYINIDLHTIKNFSVADLQMQREREREERERERKRERELCFYRKRQENR